MIGGDSKREVKVRTDASRLIIVARPGRRHRQEGASRVVVPTRRLPNECRVIEHCCWHAWRNGPDENENGAMRLCITPCDVVDVSIERRLLRNGDVVFDAANAGFKPQQQFGHAALLVT